jgi:hypothetical protein
MGHFLHLKNHERILFRLTTVVSIRSTEEDGKDNFSYARYGIDILVQSQVKVEF